MSYKHVFWRRKTNRVTDGLTVILKQNFGGKSQNKYNCKELAKPAFFKSVLTTGGAGVVGKLGWRVTFFFKPSPREALSSKKLS